MRPRLSPAPLWLLLCGTLTIGCSPSPAVTLPPHYQPYAPPPRLPVQPAPAAQPVARFVPEVAVLPIEDGRLFRQERAALRLQLHGELTRRLPGRTLLPLSEVDAKLRPVAPKSGARCAYQGVQPEQRARRQGWAHTELMHVFGTKGKPEQLWVDVERRGTQLVSFAALFDAKRGRFAGYQNAFRQLQPNPKAGVLGGLGALADLTSGVHAGGVTLCETRLFGSCTKSSAWQDVVEPVAACFAGEDEAYEKLLVQQQPGGARCEIRNLDETEGKRGQREACLCAAVGRSTAMAQSRARRTLRIYHLDPALKDRPRPQLRVVEASTNLRAERDWHVGRNRRTKQSLPSVNRLTVENLDALAAPLSRCEAQPGSTLLAELSLSGNGTVSDAAILAPGDGPLKACAAEALKRGAFSCSDNGEAARLRITAAWPRWPQPKAAKPKAAEPKPKK